jgi:predicted peptidase
MRKLMSCLILFSVLLTACKKEAADDNPDMEPDTPETAPPVQKGITYNVSTNIQGYQEALPARYDSTTKKYPLLVFVHGVGELGNGSTDLYKVANVAIPALIKNKKFPPAFDVNGKSYSFIVLSPQCKNWPSALDVNALINYAVSKYRVDTTRLYVAGLSMGGGITWESGAVYAQRLSAIVPICGASSPDDNRSKKIAQAGLAVWAFHNKNDSTVTYTNSTGYVTKINGFGANPPAKLTLWETGGHNAWTKATDPAYKENNMNIYEWMLQYHR